MRITEVFVRILDPHRHKGIVARCNLLLDDQLTLYDVVLIERADGTLFLGTPRIKQYGAATRPRSKTRRDSDGRDYHFREIAALANADVRRYWETVLIGAYDYVLGTGRETMVLIVKDEGLRTKVSA